MFCHVQVVKNLGKGAFGKVKLVQDTKDGKFYALKIMDKMVLKKKRQVRPEREVHAYRGITSSFQHIFLFCACVCVLCVCACDRERGRERERVCVCV